MKRMFLIDDWVFCEFTLQQIKEMESGKVTSVSDGYFSLSGSDLTDRCFELTMENKVKSDAVNYWSKQFHAIKINGLNHPDLKRKLISIWVDLCEENNNDILKQMYSDLDKFGKAVMDEVNDLKFKEVDGVNLFRR